MNTSVLAVLAAVADPLFLNPRLMEKTKKEKESPRNKTRKGRARLGHGGWGAFIQVGEMDARCASVAAIAGKHGLHHNCH